MHVANIVLSEADLGHVFLSILFLLCSAHFFGHIFNRLGMPRVVGEIFSGIILGPSLLGLFFPEYYKNLFNFFSEEGKILVKVLGGYKNNYLGISKNKIA